jgi:hypothetical protein
VRLDLHRPRLLVALVAMLLVTIVTAVVAIAALHVATTRSQQAVAAFESELALAERLVVDAHDLVAAAHGARHTELGAARAAFGFARDRMRVVADIAPLERAADALVAAPEQVSTTELETTCAVVLRRDRGALDDALAAARRIARRAEITILLLALIGIAIVAGLFAVIARELDLMTARLALIESERAPPARPTMLR